ncbi:hypothetical protein NQ317_000654 [Molorchus minor]|uniref:Ribosomal protein L20 n=1 Tax=Molorchus minor TaxID=1323400 RepID=A0ABQ9J3A8_9CUCU|nr:hypothetical protein NQ317_000654 [Molorchus minor]
MSVKRFFRWTGYSCIKVLKNWTTSFHNRYKRKYHKNGSILSLSTYGRTSISTEITVLEYDMLANSVGSQPITSNNEIIENRLNERIERRKWSV